MPCLPVVVLGCVMLIAGCAVDNQPTSAWFRVAGQQRNMLMLEVEGTATVRGADATTKNVPVHNLINRSVTSEGMRHSDILKAMNKIANESSSRSRRKFGLLGFNCFQTGRNGLEQLPGAAC